MAHRDTHLPAPSLTEVTEVAGPLGVRASALTKRFGVSEALRDVSLTIPPGSFSVLIGPSGCGKTTLLRLMGALDTPTEGAISYLNRAGDKVNIDKRALSYGFQEPRLLPWLSVYDNVALPLSLRGESPEQQRPQIEELLERVGLSDAHHKRPHELSGGMRMRAAIARALITSPRLLLLDEPFGALDEITKNRLDDELLSLWQRLEVTVVLVTHSLSEAVYLGQQVHILAAQPGRLSATLEVNLSERSPKTRTTQEFAGYVAEAHRLLALAELGEPSLEPQHTEEAHA
jgi:NitT/TauT family transport system ATP-binding protein